MKKRLVGLLCTLMFSASALAGCQVEDLNKSNQSNDDNVIKIGVLQPLTGANAAGGQLELDGIKLANKLYPEVLGKKVELVVVDNKSDKVESASAAARLVEKEKVTAIIGSSCSSLSMAAGEIIKNAQIPTVAATASSPLVTQGNDFYFRVCFIDPVQGTAMANYAFNKLNARKVAIIQEVSNDYAVGLAKYFSDSFTKLTGDKGSIIAKANYNTGDQDFTAQLTNIKAKNPDVIFAPGNFTESALLIKQARQLGITAPILGGDTWENPELIKVGGSAVEGATLTTFFSSEKPLTKETEKFLAEYKKQYGAEEPTAYTALAYDAYLLLIDGLKRTGEVDSVKLRDELLKTKDFQGASGVLNFDKNRNAIKDVVIKQVKDGKFKFVDISSVDNK